jgi:prevent-host-death family protein
VGAYQAKTHLPRLLKDVAAGEYVTITRHGAPVARLVPVPEGATVDAKQAIAALRAFRRGHTLRGVTVRELIEEGRRY